MESTVVCSFLLLPSFLAETGFALKTDLDPFFDWLQHKGLSDSTSLAYTSAVGAALQQAGGDKGDESSLRGYYNGRSRQWQLRLRTAWRHYRTFCKETDSADLPWIAPRAATLSHDLLEALGTLALKIRPEDLHRVTWGQVNVEKAFVLNPDCSAFFIYEGGSPVRAALQTLLAWGEPPNNEARLLPRGPGDLVPASYKDFLKHVKKGKALLHAKQRVAEGESAEKIGGAQPRKNVRPPARPAPEKRPGVPPAPAGAPVAPAFQSAPPAPASPAAAARKRLLQNYKGDTVESMRARLGDNVPQKIIDQMGLPTEAEVAACRRVEAQ